MLKFSHIIPNSKGVFMTKCTIQRSKGKSKGRVGRRRTTQVDGTGPCVTSIVVRWDNVVGQVLG